MKKINIRGVIVSNDDQWVYDFFGLESTCPKQVTKAIDEANGDEIEVDINSPGGYVYAGSEIYTAIKAYIGVTTTKILSLAASAASIIAMAGKRVLISPTAQIMIHNVQSIAQGDYRDLQHEADVIKNYNDTIANAYRLKTGMDNAALLKMMGAETWMTAQQAKEKGFVDEIMFDDTGQLDLVAAAGGIEMIPRSVINAMRNKLQNPANELDFLVQKNNLLRLKGRT